MNIQYIFLIALFTMSCQSTDTNTEVPEKKNQKEESILDIVFIRQYVNMPFRLFDDAIKQYENGQKDLCARRIKKAADYMQIIVNNAPEESKNGLHDSMLKLKKLSERVTAGDTIEQHEFNSVFAESILAISENTKVRGQKYIDFKK